MSEIREKVQFWMRKAAKGARAIGQALGGTEGTAILVGAGILEGIADLLEQRTPEEVRQLIYELVAHPAKKIDLTDAEREVARILAERRARDAVIDEEDAQP